MGAGGIVALLRWRLWSSGVPDVDPAPLTRLVRPGRARPATSDYRRGRLDDGRDRRAARPPRRRWASRCSGRAGARALVRAARARPWRAGALFGAGLDGGDDGGRAARSRSRATPGAATTASSPRASPRGCSTWRRASGSRSCSRRPSGPARPSLIARCPRWWWAVAAVGVGALIYAMSLLSPLLLEPIFQRTEPLRDPALSAQVLELADRAGVKADDVKVNDASTPHDRGQRLRLGPRRQPPHRPLRHAAARLPARPGADGGRPRAGPRRAAARAEGVDLGGGAGGAGLPAGLRGGRAGAPASAAAGRGDARAPTWWCGGWPSPPPRPP